MYDFLYLCLDTYFSVSIPLWFVLLKITCRTKVTSAQHRSEVTMLPSAPVKMLANGKKPSIYWKLCEGAFLRDQQKHKSGWFEFGQHLFVGSFEAFLPSFKMVSRKKDMFLYVFVLFFFFRGVVGQVRYLFEFRVYFANNLLEDSQNIGFFANCQEFLVTTGVLTWAVKPSCEG